MHMHMPHAQVCDVLGGSQNTAPLHPSATGPYNCPCPAILVKPLLPTAGGATAGLSDVRT